MRKTDFFEIAGHIIKITSEFFFDNYQPFWVKRTPKEEILLSMDVNFAPYKEKFSVEMLQNEEGQKIVCGHTLDGKHVFEFWLSGTKTGVLICENKYTVGKLYIERAEFAKFSFDNAAMIMFALASADKSTLLFHSSTVVFAGLGYMFLGRSGTGKSTHSRLWLENIKGTTLLNDDNPVVRIFPNGVKVFGSPWSGKTECYKNEVVPLGGIVLLSQAKQNRISKLNGIIAYASLIPSISGKRWDKKIADSLHISENSIVEKIKMWHLECLPDSEAAFLCNKTITC